MSALPSIPKYVTYVFILVHCRRTQNSAIYLRLCVRLCVRDRCVPSPARRASCPPTHRFPQRALPSRATEAPPRLSFGRLGRDTPCPRSLPLLPHPHPIITLSRNDFVDVSLASLLRSYLVYSICSIPTRGDDPLRPQPTLRITSAVRRPASGRGLLSSSSASLPSLLLSHVIFIDT